MLRKKESYQNKIVESEKIIAEQKKRIALFQGLVKQIDLMLTESIKPEQDFNEHA